MQQDIKKAHFEGLTSEGLEMSFTAHYAPDQDAPIRIIGVYRSLDDDGTGGFFDVDDEASLPFVVSGGTFKPVRIEKS